MTDFRPRFALGVLLAVVLAAACDTAPSGPAVVTATIVSDGAPVPGAVAELRLLPDSSVPATVDAGGRVRVEVSGVRGPGLLEVARDTAEPRPERVYAPLLLAPGDSAALTVALDRERGRRVRYRSDTRMARWGWAARAINAIERAHWAAFTRPGEPQVDYGGVVDSVRAALRDEADPEVRSVLWVAWVRAASGGAELTAEEAERALKEIDPGAAIWALRPADVPSVARLAAVRAERGRAGDSVGGQELAGRNELAFRRSEAYVDRVIDAFAGTEIQAQILLGALEFAVMTNRHDAAFAYYDRLEATHPDSRWTEVAADELPRPDLQVGSPAPEVSLPALDSTAPPIQPTELAGPATLVDFWAAWCTPCVAEMPVIHEAYERFRDRGFDVVSVSFDAYREDVHRFRERYPMPWRHSFVGAAALGDGEVAAAWGVEGLPSAYLIGPDGRIIALENELRGEALAETLERVLGG